MEFILASKEKKMGLSRKFKTGLISFLLKLAKG